MHNQESGLAQSSINILIADDDDGDRKQITRALKNAAMQAVCTETSNIKQALDACDECAFDCAIVDYRIPGQDGLDGITALHERLPFMAILMVTGQGDEGVATEAMKRGASDYMQKTSITAQSIRRAVGSALERAALVRMVAQQRDDLESRIKALVEAERLILETLADKEVLLKEVHHRVKNNLQVICSLLGLQAASIDDPQTLAALKNSQNRVQSMALVHELLYGSETLGDIDFSVYAKRLLDELLHSNGLESSRIRLRSEMTQMSLGIDRAVPCGLILNELISNSLKYAFPAGATGEIVVSLAPCGQQQVCLAVADDGVGLPENFKLDSTKSLGLRIVQILARQLRGKLSVIQGKGTRFEVLFPVS